MTNYKIESTNKSPYIFCEARTGTLEISGRSIPFEPKEFYKPMHEWINSYCLTPAPITIFSLRFEYLNKPTRKEITAMLYKLRDLNQSGKSEVSVNWYCDKEDPDMLDLGEDYLDVFKGNFNIIAIPQAPL